MDNFSDGFLLLPTDLYRILFKYLTIVDIFLFSYINQKFNKLILHTSPEIINVKNYAKLKIIKKFMKNLIKFGYLDMIIYYYSKGYKLPKNVYNIASKHGQLDIMKYVHQNMKDEYHWDEVACDYAAFHGNVECLKYLHENGCPWWEFQLCWSAVCGGHLECLKYAHENGCKWSKAVCWYAAYNGQLECLKYAHENGCPWDKASCKIATNRGHLECLKYLHENGCPWDSDITYDFSIYDQECLKYAVLNGCFGIKKNI